MSETIYFNILRITLRSEARRAGSDGSVSSGSAGQGFDPRRGSKFSFENFQPRGYEGWRCKLSNRQIVHHRPGLNFKPFRSIYAKKTQAIILLIAIRPSDGDIKPGGPLGAFREEQAMSQVPDFTFSLSFTIIPHSTTQLHHTMGAQITLLRGKRFSPPIHCCDVTNLPYLFSGEL